VARTQQARAVTGPPLSEGREGACHEDVMDALIDVRTGETAVKRIVTNGDAKTLISRPRRAGATMLRCGR